MKCSAHTVNQKLHRVRGHRTELGLEYDTVDLEPGLGSQMVGHREDLVAEAETTRLQLRQIVPEPGRDTAENRGTRPLCRLIGECRCERRSSDQRITRPSDECTDVGAIEEMGIDRARRELRVGEYPDK